MCEQPCRGATNVGTYDVRPAHVQNPPSLTRSASLWFGTNASKDRRLTLAADAVAISLALAGSSALHTFWRAWQHSSSASTHLLFSRVIPMFAFGALSIALLIMARTVAHTTEARFPSAHRPRFGRKGTLICGLSILFILSCCYRAVFVADEGASLCRGRPTLFNAPVSGRAVATIGEGALVLQISCFLDDSARRLRVEHAWAGRWRFTLLPVCLAESFSWCGVLSGDSKFYCAEYVCWCALSITWAWDAAELLHHSTRWSDVLTHAAVCCAALALFAFNATVEIPHFFRYHPSDTHDAATVKRLSVLKCSQDVESALWLKRLPFFFSYFLVASWGSAALSYRYLRRGGLRRTDD